MKNLFDLFRPAPHVPLIENAQERQRTYQYWRTRMFYASFLGYVFYYFSRKSLSFAVPALSQDLGLSKGDLGILFSILSITYGVSKFVSGILADRSNPRYFMSIGLIITGILNILFGFSSHFWMFVVLWALNGWFQGFGWPPALRILVHWYDQKERGWYAALWNTSHNLGGALIPLLVAFCIPLGGWRLSLWAPGVLCILAGFFVMNRLRDTPQSLGLPRIEEYHNQAAVIQDDERELNVKEILFDYVFKNPAIWFLSLANMTLYIVRTAFNDWSMLYFMEVRGLSELQSASMVSWFEIGGFLGMLFAGFISDKWFGGAKGLVSVGLMGLTALPVWALFMTETGSSAFIYSCFAFMVGFFLFGPQMLVGCIAAEISHKKAAATASGVTGCFAYVGAALSGYPLGIVIQQYGWEAFFLCMTFMCVLSAFCFVIIAMQELKPLVYKIR